MKILNHQENKLAVKMLENEFHHASKLNHPNIIKVIEAKKSVIMTENDKKTKVAFIAQELAPRGDFFNYLVKNGGLPTPIVLYYAKQLLMAVNHMHTKEVAHRDLKCENILLDNNFNLKVADFGLACSI